MIVAYDDGGYIEVTNDAASLYSPRGTLICKFTEHNILPPRLPLVIGDYEFSEDENGDIVMKTIRRLE